MSYFIRNGNKFSVADENAITVFDNLPPQNYVLKVDPFGNFFLEIIDEFTNPSRLYGNISRMTERILRTFQDRSGSTGVILAGEKGSGKTLLARNLAIKSKELNIPCIIINTPFHGDSFNKFVQDVQQECILLFDEFEKVYDADQQKHILTLMDGVYPSKKLFILTCNDPNRVDHHMRNRPGRMFYFLTFNKLEDAFIREYCEENLINKEHLESICNITSLFWAFNFDMLKALVEEMNRYGEDPKQALEFLNIKPELSGKSMYDVEYVPNPALIGNRYVLLDTKVININPLTDAAWVELRIYDKKPSFAQETNDDNPFAKSNSKEKQVAELAEVDYDYYEVSFENTDIEHYSQRRIVYKDNHGNRLTLRKKEDEGFNYMKFSSF